MKIVDIRNQAATFLKDHFISALKPGTFMNRLVRAISSQKNYVEGQTSSSRQPDKILILSATQPSLGKVDRSVQTSPGKVDRSVQTSPVDEAPEESKLTIELQWKKGSTAPKVLHVKGSKQDESAENAKNS